MPKYTSESGDWVEISGAAWLPMKKLDEVFAFDRNVAHARMQKLITASCFNTYNEETGAVTGTVDVSVKRFAPVPADAGPEYVPVPDYAIFSELITQQWDWLRQQFYPASRDEKISPQL